jgi:hypothetical protein
MSHDDIFEGYESDHYVLDERARNLHLQDIRDKQKKIDDWFRILKFDVAWFKNEQYKSISEYQKKEKLFKKPLSMSFNMKLQYIQHVGASYLTGFHDLSTDCILIRIIPNNRIENVIYNKWLFKILRRLLIDGRILYHENSVFEVYNESKKLIEQYQGQVSKVSGTAHMIYHLEQKDYVKRFLKESDISRDLISSIKSLIKSKNEEDVFAINYQSPNNIITIARLWDILQYDVFLDLHERSATKHNSADNLVNLIPYHDDQIRFIFEELIKGLFIDPNTSFETFRNALKQLDEPVERIHWILYKDENEVNKVPLTLMLDDICDDEPIIMNKYIIKYFCAYVKGQEIAFTREALNTSRSRRNTRLKNGKTNTYHEEEIRRILKEAQSLG